MNDIWELAEYVERMVRADPAIRHPYPELLARKFAALMLHHETQTSDLMLPVLRT